jgi:hypothetical protein
VCNCPARRSQRDAQLHHQRNAAAKNSPPARFSAQKWMQRRNADELRVSALSQFSLRRENSTRQRSIAENFFTRRNADAANFATRKNFRAERVYGRVEGPHATQNARISAK